ncbi:hypothetical protein [Phormidesmis priestleyi]
MSHESKLPRSLDDIPLPNSLPPIVLVAFTRPELLQQVLSAISQQSLLPQQILAFVDGARSPKDELLINECVSLLKDFSQKIPVEIVVRPENLGCDRNVVAALTGVSDRYDSFIYLEDDVVPNLGFYDRLCRLLEAYRNHPQVGSVSAFANFPNELEPLIDRDFIVSNRVFALGFGMWSDRWQKLNLAGQDQGSNPFKHYYEIPATIQTKHTLLNQFFIEKNRQTDWVITLTLNALSHNLVHITPKVSFVKNIGFGHPEAKTYRGAEPDWINFRFDPDAHPNSLPDCLELMDVLAKPLKGVELVQHLEKSDGVWLSLPAIAHFLQKYQSFENMSAFLKLFLARAPIMLRRWRSGLPV